MTYATLFLISTISISFGFGETKLTRASPMPGRIVSSLYSRNKTDLVLHSIVNYSGRYFSLGPVVTESIRIAVEAADRSGVLPEYNIVADNFDEACYQPFGISHVTRTLRDMSSRDLVPFILGPICSSHMFTGRIVKYFNFMQLGVLATSPITYIDRRSYDSYYLTMPSITGFLLAIPPFLTSQGWKKVYLISETYLVWGPIEEALFDQLDVYNVSLSGVTKIYMPFARLPAQEHFDRAAKEVASSGSRIFILNSHSAANFACWLHKYGLFGPEYVFITPASATFRPNAYVIYDWCTPNMLLDVMKSVFYVHSYSKLETKPESRDWLGTSGNYFDSQQKERINRPDLYGGMWFALRAYGYEQISFAVKVMSDVEKKLTSSGDTLANWLTSTDNFKANGSYLHGLIIETLDTLKFNGLISSTESSPLNSLTGPMTVFQFQPDGNTTDVSAVFVAIYQNKIVKMVGNPMIWRTPNGLPPFDSMRFFDVKVDLMTPILKWILTVLASLLILLNLTIFGKLSRSESFKGVISVGAILSTSTTIIICHAEPSVTLCSSAFLLSVCGVSLMFTGLLGRLYFLTKFISKSRYYPAPRRRRIRQSIAAVDARLTNAEICNILKFSLFTCVVIAATLSSLIIALILSANLFEISRHVENIVYPTNEPSSAYRFYVTSCTMPRHIFSKATPAALLGTITVLLCAVVIRSVFFIITIPRNYRFKDFQETSNYTGVKMLTYSICVLTVASGIVLSIIASTGNPSIQLISAASVSMVISLPSSVVFHIPRIVSAVRRENE